MVKVGDFVVVVKNTETFTKGEIFTVTKLDGLHFYINKKNGTADWACSVSRLNPTSKFYYTFAILPRTSASKVLYGS